MSSISNIHSTRQSRLVRGFGAKSLSLILQIFVRLIEVPLLLSFWGAELYGEWLIIAAIPIYFSLADGGFASAACREMSIRGGAGDREGVLSVFQSTWVLLIAVSVLLALFVLVLAKQVGFAGWIHFSAIGPDALRAVVYLFIVHVLLVFQETLLIGGFWSVGRYPLYMFLASITQLLEFGGLVAALLSGGGVVQAAMGYVVGRLTGFVLVRSVLKKICPWIGYGFAGFSLQELRKISVPAVASLVLPFGNALNIQGVRIVIGLVLGPAAVALFATLRTLSRFAMQPCTLIAQMMEPELALTYGSKDGEQFERLFMNSCRGAFWSALCVWVLLLFTSDWLFPLWTHHKVEIHWPVYALLLAAAVIHTLWYPALMALYATNRHGRISFAYGMIYGAAVLVLSYAGVKAFGLTGAGIVLAMAEAAMAVYVLSAAVHLCVRRTSHWFHLMLRPPFFLIAHCFASLRRLKPL
jgi:O-antigen/teichoic acid export membrane protein